MPLIILSNGGIKTVKGVFMKKVLFVLLCVAAVAAVPACKRMSCKKEVAAPVVPAEPAAPAPIPAQ